MKKTVLFTLALTMVMTFSSCHKEGKFSPSKKISRIYQEYGYTGYSSGRYLSQVWHWNNKNKKQLKSIDYYSSNGSLWYEEKYNYEKGRISRITIHENYEYPEYTDFTYDGGKLTRAARYYRDKLSSEYTFTYKNGKISTINVISYSHKNKETVKNNSNVLSLILPELSDRILEKISNKLENEKGKMETYTYSYSLEWEGNNVSALTFSEYGEREDYTFTYDRKNNPFYGLLEMSLDFYTNSKNNIISEMCTEYEDGGDIDSYLDTYTYTYEGNWPVSKRYQYGDEYGVYYYEYVK